MNSRTLSAFKDKHDQSTLIKNLTKELEDAKGQIGMQSAIKAALGTVALQLDKQDVPAWVSKVIKHGAPGVPTLFISDLHWGEVVYPNQVDGVNEFGLSIAARRLKHTVSTAVHLLRILDPKLGYPGIVVPLGGDMVSGDIHEELATTNELPTIPTVLNLHDELVGAIKLLADTFGNVFLPCVSGNHGRNTKKIQAKNRNATSFDWMLYQMLARTMAHDKRVKFFVPDGSDAAYSVYGTRYLLTHGDQFKAGDSIIGPLGPLARGRQKKLARNQSVGKPFDIMIAGHWHQYIHMSSMIINGSLKGYDEYAASNNFGFEPPQQALWVTHPKYGVNWRMPVLCEEPASASKTPWVATQGRDG